MHQPNILLYFTDQQRWDTLGCYGQALPISPCLDKLASNGILYENAFSPQPVCGPFRAILQTGLYPTQTGCFRNNIALPNNVKTLAQYFANAGYDTAYVGKWHLASDGELESKPRLDYQCSAIPVESRGGYQGFWRASDLLEFTSHGYDGYVFDENNRRIDFHGYRPNCMTDFALEYLNAYDGSKPFFLTISQIEPHHQNDHHHYEGPHGSKQRFGQFELPKDLAALGGNAQEEYADYLGACRSLDDNLARLVHCLQEKNLYDNTVIVFVSDHGSHFKTRNHDDHLSGFDDYKRSCHDACLHVPLVIGGGAITAHADVEALVSTISVPKTLLSIAGIVPDAIMAGENLLTLAKDIPSDRPNQVFAQISESRVGRCLRTPEYLYAVYAPGLHGGTAMNSSFYRTDFLYDLKADPYQLHNLANDENYGTVRQLLANQLLCEMQNAGEPTATIEA